jgi:hypothetical protein
LEGTAEERFEVMLNTILLTAVLGGIAGLVVFELVCEGVGCSRKLRDRYHE